ncbi:MAG: hypothetical protein R3195_19290 [Gemmatimonadota bacterium]|nr:hypothetical protein [Gemmatimonadota bacterium]
MKWTMLRAVGAASILFVLAVSPVSAQREAVHRGFWISFGFGAGNAFGDDAFEDDSQFGGAGFLRMGGSPSQQWLIGGEMIGWGNEIDDVAISRGAVLFTAMHYPSAGGGFYLKGSAGFAGRATSTTIVLDGEEVDVSDETGGIGLGAGLGYDLQLARNFFLTPALDFLYTGTEGDGATLLLFTIGATWH